MNRRVLAIDYGDVRTGLAVSDLTGFLASGIGTITPGGMRNTAVEVARIAAERMAVRIVVGLPRNMDGTEGERAQTVRAFAALLAELTDLPILFYDERMTTMEAQRFLDYTESYGKRRKSAIDTLSAQIILQNYLDTHPFADTD